MVTATVKEVENAPSLITVMGIEPPVILEFGFKTGYGTMALICVAETYRMGAATLPNMTVVAPSAVSTWPWSGVKLRPGVGPRLVPKILMISPGDTEPPMKLAALTMAVTAGPVAADTVRFTVIFAVCPGRAVDVTATVPV